MFSFCKVDTFGVLFSTFYPLEHTNSNLTFYLGLGHRTFSDLQHSLTTRVHTQLHKMSLFDLFSSKNLYCTILHLEFKLILSHCTSWQNLFACFKLYLKWKVEKKLPVPDRKSVV